MAWIIWADLFVRSSILILAAESVRKLLRPSSAAQRHRILLFAFIFLAALPLLSALLPAVRVPLLTASSSRSAISVQSVVLGTISGAQTHPRIVPWPLLLWCCGAFACLAFILAGHLFSLRVLRRAEPLRHPEWIALLNQLSSAIGLPRTPAILTIDAHVMPFVLGWRQPRVLLPLSCLEWAESRRRAVLVHELAHIHRRDLAAGLLASCSAALWWFQPLVWVIRRALRRESEKACDALVIATGIRPSDYAAELIAIAREFKSGRFRSVGAIAMACPRDLEGRVLEILDSHPELPRKIHTFRPVALLAAAAVATSAITLSSDSRFHFSGDTHMKRTLMSGLLASASLSAATLSGSVSDATGLALPDAHISLYNPDNSATEQATSASDGKFTFDGLPAGQYILRVEKSGFAALFREFTLDANSTVDRPLVLMTAVAQPAAPVESVGNTPAKPQILGPGRFRIGGMAMEAKLIRKVQPLYPPAAKAARIQGTVLIEAEISKDGTPGELTVLQSPDDDLSQSALEAVRQWRYQTTLLNGQPIEVVTDIIVNYTLSQ